jgi:hypothetical protein
VTHVLSVQCNYCSKWRPEFRVHRITNAQTICDHCLEWHLHAIDFLGGETAPHGCQECGATWEQLRDFTPDVEVRMYVVPKDGIYQLLCSACVRPYLPKRADLFRGTEFGSKTLNL